MSAYNILTVDQIDRSQLAEFLNSVYRRPKNEFLHSCAEWWHRGNQNRWAILADGIIAGYFGVIPTICLINGVQEPAWWWVDLVVAPEFRGQGLETLLDREVRKNSKVKLGFPNELASKIHRKHGWGLREDLQVLMLPLRPLNMKKVRKASDFRAFLLRLAALALTPLASIGHQCLRRYTPLTAKAVELLSPDVFEAVFEKYRRDNMVTTYRDPEFFGWRYLEAPYRSELAFYIAGPCSCPTHFLIARHASSMGVKTTRILDVFGDFHDRENLADILKLTVKDALLQGSSQVTILVTLPELRSVLRSIGFVIGAKVRFCWHGPSQPIMRSLSGRTYWTLADSDNDTEE
ncbi:MAG: hypothetical protein GTO12_07830 [Proteobacteria bacterium]|nr:hypothetical protein [Pseudomonadota bacterium]